ncbi:MAG: hypothetical protein KF749_08795 [Bacteroidetes bacterium]|nr:hypothetical protein [Bacteroidota bacterium]MCW5895896.1 hypothetical protein [Bacteroidota bacterium]
MAWKTMNKLSFPLFCILFLFAPLHAQTWNVTVFMQPFPSPYLSDWENNPTIGSLTITNNTSAPADAIIHLTIRRSNGSTLASGNSNPVFIQPAVPTQINSDRFIDWNTVSYDAGIRTQTIQTGRLPEGEYNACITLRDMSGTILATNVCAPFTIVYPNPPTLFLPMNGDTLHSAHPVFTWTPVNVPPAYQLRYVMRMVEILAGQTPHQALLANVVQFEDDNLLTTNLQYPVGALTLEAGKTYAWQVQAVDQNGFPPAANQGRSEIWTFVTREIIGQPPTHPPSGNPLFLKIVRASTGTLGNPGGSSFENFRQELSAYNSTGGTVALALPALEDTSVAPRDTIITIEASGGFHFNPQKRSWAIKGRLWGNDVERAEILLAGIWGNSMDLRKTIVVLKRPFLLSQIFPDVFDGLTEGFLILSPGDFSFAPSDLPDSIAGFITDSDSATGTTTTVAGFFGAEDEIDVKAGLNLLARFDLRHAPRLTDFVSAWGVEDPHLKLTGFISGKWEWAVARSGGQTQNYTETTFGMELMAQLPLMRSQVPWLPELDAKFGISWKQKRRAIQGPDSLERKLAPKIGLTGKVTFPFLRSMNFLNDTIAVTGMIEFEFDSPGTPDIVAKLEFDDIVKFERFENVFRVHDPKFEWNISKWMRNEGGLRLKASFDFAQITNVGAIEVQFEKESDSAQVKLERRRAGVWDPTNPPENPRHAGQWPPANPPENRRHAGVWAATNPEPLKGAKPESHWKPKVVVRFDPVALASLQLSLVLRTALGDGIFGDAGNEFSTIGRNRTPPPNYAPPEIPDFFNNLPTLEELSMSFRPGTLGSMVVRGRTSFQNSSTEIIVARAESATKTGFLLGLKPNNWSIRNYFPNFSMPGLDNLTLSNLALVFSTVEGMMPSVELSDEEFEFYSAAYGSDDFMVVIKEGLNLIASIPGENLGSSGPLAPIMEKLGVERGTLLLQGSLGRRLQDIYLLAVFPSIEPPGAPEWFRSGEMAIELTGQPSIGLVGALTVAIEGDDVTFLLKTKASPSGLILAGGMASTEGWQSPFGIEWLTLNRVMFLLGVTPAGSVQLGFNADMVIGTKDIDVAVLVAISPTGVPTNFMFDGESEAGFGLDDVMDLHAKIAAASGQQGIPLDAIPPLGLKDAKLKFAPKDSPELGITRGMAIGGMLYLRSGTSTKEIASALLDISLDGIIARGNIAPFTLGPVKLEQATMDLTLTRQEQYFILAGRTNLGFMDAAVDMHINKTSAMFETETKIFNVFQAQLKANAAINILQPAFNVNAKMKNDFNEAVAPQLRQAIKDAVTQKKNAAKAEADKAELQWQDAVRARDAAQKKWADLPLLPRDPKVAARKALEAAIAKAAPLRVQKELAEGKERRWTLANNLLSQFQQQAGSGNFVVIRKAEFEADLANLKTGAVKKMALDARVGNRDFDLALTGWNFKNMGASVKGAAQNIADKLFASFQ